MGGYLPFDTLPAYCVNADGHVGCPLAWNPQFCSLFSPKGLNMTNRDWGDIYEAGVRPDWCPIRSCRALPEKYTADIFLRDIKPGQTVFITADRTADHKQNAPYTGPATVHSVGRTYVYLCDENGNKDTTTRFHPRPTAGPFLTEQVDYRPARKLFLTREAADAWTERMELIAWFRRYSTPYWIDRYSVEQLRACKAILEQPVIRLRDDT